MKKVTYIAAAVIAAGLLTGGASGCTSDATTVSDNLSTAADQFEVQRRIVGINGFTDKPAFIVEGRCSIKDEGNQLEVTCKHGDDDYRKHFIGLSDNTFYVAEQMEPIDASEYHTRIVIKPESILPDFDLETSGDIEGDG
jgi:hypothetical protein